MRSHPLLLLALVGMFLAVAHARESDETELDQAAAYEVSREQLSEDATDLIQEAESATPVAAPKAKQVKIVGDTAIDATLRMFAKGGDILTVTDANNNYGVVFGTNSVTKDHFRLKPTEGDGLAINSKKDSVGLFVDAKTGYVGIGHSNPATNLHVKGTTLSTGTITTTATGGKAGLLLSGVEDFKGIQLNKDGKNLYLIGRGRALAERELSFHVPEAADYGGGKEPKFTWVSGMSHTKLAHLEASTGNMFLKGRLGIGALEPKAAVDVRGSVNIQNEAGEAVITFPRGKESGFHIRSTDNPGAYTAQDDRVYIKGENGFVGIRTTKPKAMLDVRGALNLEDASSTAIIYFPNKNKRSSFFIRCADDPSTYSKDQERFFVGSDGKVGIGTNSPTHGLTVSSEAGEGSALNDVAIMKGDLHIKGAIYDTFGGGKKYFIDMKKQSFLKTVNVESFVGVGPKKPAGIPGSNAAVHIQGEAPVLRIENTKAEGAAAVTLQVGANRWEMEGTTGSFAVKHNGKNYMTIDTTGKIGIGDKAATPRYGLHIETSAPVGDKRNDLTIRKGNLWLMGAIKQIGNPKYSFSMEKGGLIKDINVEGNLGIGLMGQKPKFALQLGKKQIMSIGDQMFMAGQDGNAFIAANAFKANGKWQLHKNAYGASALVLENTGTIRISGTRKQGTAVLDTMFEISAKTQTASFPQTGVKAGFGTANPQYPLQVNGAQPIGASKASLAFGMSETSMGYLGSNAEYVYMMTRTGQEAIALNHGTGYVGIGTGKPQSTLHLASAESPSMSFGSSSQPLTHAYIQAKPEGSSLNMIFGIKNPTSDGGKLTFDFKNEMKFGGSGPTVFSRGDTVFKSGNVGIGAPGFDKKFKLHVKGDMKVDGKVWVAVKTPTKKGAAPKKKPAPAPAPGPAPAPAPGSEKDLGEGEGEGEGEDDDFLSEMDFTDLLEEDEGRTENVHPEHGIDLGETLHGLTRVLRKQHRQMAAHDLRIGELSQQVEMMMQR